MSRFIIFGFLPITFRVDGLWYVDTGAPLLDSVAGIAVRGVLLAVKVVEGVFDIVLPIPIAPLDGPDSAEPALA